MNDNNNKKYRKIRSFVRREGRLTLGQAKALRELWPLFGLFYAEHPINIDETFCRSAETIVEIGFGMGASLIEQAINFPEKNFIGIDVHRPGIGTTLKAIDQHQLKNVRLYQQDAVDVLQHCIPHQSIDKFQIFFPDPWHKKRHHKRRLIQPDFATLLHQKLKPKGILHLATDWENYAEGMMDVLSQTPLFENCAGKTKYYPKPDDRPLTKFEKRGEKLGHQSWDLMFKKK